MRLLAALVLVNLGLWAAVIAIAPTLAGAALLAWTFGLRHALDADHIAAIDGVIRRLMAQRQNASRVGLFFSLGHSSVVIAATLAMLIVPWPDALGRLHASGVIGNVVSIVFLAVMALVNGVSALLQWRPVREGARPGAACAGPVGIMARLTAPLARMIRHERQMYPLGVLFGLGFDTATEIGLLGLMAAQTRHTAAHGWAIMLLPLLFASAMTLADSLDTVLMVRAWRWGMGRPDRRARYGLAVTALSAVSAATVALVEIASVAGATVLADHFQILGCVIVALFLALWAWFDLASSRRSA